MRAVVLGIALAFAIATPSRADSDGFSFPNDAAQNVRVDRKNVPGGAQLVTLFVPAPYDLAPEYPAGIPIVSYLKDTLGDSNPENDRIRQVWVLTAGKQSHVRRALNALPFISFGRDEGTTSGMPSASVDLGDPAHGTWSNIAQVVIQGQVLDPTGMALRTSSRAYAWNSQSRDDLNVYEAMSLLGRLDGGTLPGDIAADVRTMHARLLLSRRTIGGLVRDKRLNRVYDADETNRELARAHNWELVRQEAEANGLYFEPVSFGDAEPTHAMIWVRRSDVVAKAAHHYDSGLLKIANPWGDERLIEWKGYSETWHFDANGSRVDDDSAATDQVIPLALYALNYPRVPLLVVDFRSSNAPHRREVAARVAQNVTRGVLGFSPIANWNYFAAQWMWDWVQRRHGAANDRPARLRTYAETSYLLSMDESVRGPLRAELRRRLQDSSPLLSRRAHIAASQFETLAQVDDSNGVRAILDRGRQAELTSYAHGPFARFGLTLARLSTIGLYRHTEHETQPLAELDLHRRIAYHTRVLETAVDRNVPLDEETGAPAVRASITGLMELSNSIRDTDAVRRLIDRVMARSQDDALRTACTHAIEALRTYREPAIVAGSKKPDCRNCRGSVAAAVPVAAGKIPVGGTR